MNVIYGSPHTSIEVDKKCLYCCFQYKKVPCDPSNLLVRILNCFATPITKRTNNLKTNNRSGRRVTCEQSWPCNYTPHSQPLWQFFFYVGLILVEIVTLSRQQVCHLCQPLISPRTRFPRPLTRARGRTIYQKYHTGQFFPQCLKNYQIPLKFLRPGKMTYLRIPNVLDLAIWYVGRLPKVILPDRPCTSYFDLWIFFERGKYLN